jgi:peptide/nickel transport system substrate-binding protein
MKRPMHILAAVGLILTLALAACGSPSPAATPTTAPAKAPAGAATKAPSSASPVATKPAAEAPKSGGTLTLPYPGNADVSTFNDAVEGAPGVAAWIQAQELLSGDWTKGIAGGYGTKETNWDITSIALFSLKSGWLAESWQVSVDNEKKQGPIVFKVRQGVKWAKNPNSEAAALVNGREMTADDVLTSIQQSAVDTRAWNFRNYPELRNNIDVTKTGPWEVTVKVPIEGTVTALHALGDTMRIYPSEIRDGKIDMANWKNQIGTGPFVMTNYVSGSSITLKKNPDYWMKDPIGPGKGNQLPYLDGVEYLIIPDLSTRLTAFRTGKVDYVENLTWEDAEQMKKQSPQALTAEGNYSIMTPTYIRTDKAPYNDVRVRRAMMMATDFNTIKQSMNGGRGIIITYPYEYYKEYTDLYAAADAPDLPASVKEIYTYNPTKAKQLLAEAGYPNGIKTSVVTPPSETSFYELLAGMWAKAGIELALDIQDPPVLSRTVNGLAYNHLIASPGKPPAPSYYVASTLKGAPGLSNPSFVDDAKINEMLPRIRVLSVTDVKESMKLTREMVVHVYDQVYAIPRPSYRTSTFWWPWIKNYSGEISIGFINGPNWVNFVWVDQQLKQSMGR